MPRFIHPLLLVLLAVPVCAQPIDVVRYSADVRIDFTDKALYARAGVLLRNVMRSEIRTVALDLRGLGVDSVRQGGARIPFVQDDTMIVSTLASPLRSLDTTEVEVFYHGLPTHEPNTMKGPVIDSEALCQPEGMYVPYLAMLPHWLPCHNDLSDKALYDLTFVVPAGMEAAAGGLLVSRVIGDSLSRFRWVISRPAPVQVVGWAVGPYSARTDTCAGLPVMYYALPSDTAALRTHFTNLWWMLRTLSERFGPYPGEKVGFCITPMGAVEVQDMIFLGIRPLGGTAGDTEMHELAHHWFGNSVTPASREENWLSEGFAQFGGWLFSGLQSGTDRINLACAPFVHFYIATIAASEGAFPLYRYTDFTNWNYCGTIYFKGALVLNMLRNIVGSDAFFSALRS